ncbi:hypothetical protein VZC37_22895 [Gordonia sp. LSe1-13]|uniref:Uncharacterized protein n=1 Tax=Gordonia sesuvii TaxID=3116777 RepID=A0ABU7MJA5_9ACTN|nr:hypothetical protein [Gordonia sp. LSe1-13]
MTADIDRIAVSTVDTARAANAGALLVSAVAVCRGDRVMLDLIARPIARHTREQLSDTEIERLNTALTQI